MHREERAIIMGAGLGTRLRPATNNIPKPMVKVNGVRIIETVIEALYANGISEIHIVTGYKAEAYEELKAKYPDIDFVHNPYYETRNNISSMYVVREHLHNCICIDGDNMILNPEVAHAEFEYSGYAAVERHLDETLVEWFMHTDEQGIVRSTTTQDTDGWQLFGICRLTEEDGRRIAKHLEEEYEIKKNYDSWWDEIALMLYKDEFEFRVSPIKLGDIVEIDSYAELLSMDSSYEKN